MNDSPCQLKEGRMISTKNLTSISGKPELRNIFDKLIFWIDVLETKKDDFSNGLDEQKNSLEPKDYQSFVVINMLIF